MNLFKRRAVAEAEPADTWLRFHAHKKTSFAKKLVYYVLIWVAVIVIAVLFMRSVTAQYEASLPRTAMEDFIHSSRQDMFFFAISDELSEIENKYEDAFSVASNLAKEYTGELTYTKLATEYSAERPVYLVMHNGENLFKVSLVLSEETGFMKFCGYAVDTIELVKEDVITFKDYKLVFASNMLIYINNSKLEKKLSNFESVDVFGHEDYYGIVIESFAFPPEISARSYASNLQPDKTVTPEIIGDYYVFSREDEPLTTMSASLPKGAVLTIDSKTVSEDFIVESYTESGANGGVDMVKYVIPTVYEAKKVTATLGGMPLPLVADGMNVSATVGSESCSVVVPKGAVLYLCGEKMSDAYVTGDDALWHSALEEIGVEAATEYTLTGISSIGDLSATLDGVPLEMLTDGDKVVFAKGDEALADEFAEAAEGFVRQYLYYNTQGYLNTEENLANTLALVAPASPLRTYLTRANVGIEFNSPKSMKVDYVTADNFVTFGKDVFMCDVAYRVELNDSVNSTVEENVITLVFIESRGTFLPASFIL